MNHARFGRMGLVPRAIASFNPAGSRGLKKILFDWLFRDQVNETISRHLKKSLATQYTVYGNEAKLHIAEGAVVNNALFNLSSGGIFIEEDVFFGHNVSILTGTHDYRKLGATRKVAVPKTGNDIVIKRGAWVASGVIIIGPCTIGEHSVIAAGSVVKDDVPPYALVAGSPAKLKRSVIGEDSEVAFSTEPVGAR